MIVEYYDELFEVLEELIKSGNRDLAKKMRRALEKESDVHGDLMMEFSSIKRKNFTLLDQIEEAKSEIAELKARLAIVDKIAKPAVDDPWEKDGFL